MAGILDTIQNAIGKPGRKLYDTEKAIPSFENLTVKEKLQSLVMEKRTQDRERRQRLNLVYYLMALYYRGYQQVSLNGANGLDVYEDQDYYVENQFRRHVDTVVQILNKMEGDLIIRPASDTPKDIACARVADPVLEMQRDDVGYDRLKEEKNLYKCLFGNAFIFTDYIVDAKYGSIVTPKYSYQEVPDPTLEDPMMQDPTMMQDPMQPPVDPMQAQQPPTILSKVVDGYDKRNKGRQVATVCTPLEIVCPTEVKPFTDIPYIMWVSRQDTNTINYMYPGLNAGGGMSAIETDLAQQYIDVLNNLPGNVLGDSVAYNRGSTTRRKSELVRAWFKPCEFKGDKELERKFPEGVHVATVNGQVVDFYEEDLHDRWTHEALIPVPHTLLGDGLYDAILLQDQLNEINSLLIQHMRYTTVGKTYYDSNALDAKDIVNDPKNAHVPVKLALDKTITQSVLSTGPNQLSGDVPAWRNAILLSMQDMTGAYDPESGKSTGANTPYSQSVFLSEKAQSRWRGSHDYNYPERVRFHVQLLEDARSNWIDMRQRAVIDNTGQWSFEQFSQADLQGDVDITMSDTDFKPRTRAEQVQGLTMLTTLAPLLPAMPPKQKLRIEEMLGLPPDANPMSNQISRAYRMMDRLKKGEPIEPLPMVDDPQAQVPVFADFLASEDGEALGEAQPEIFAAIYEHMMKLIIFGTAQMTQPGVGMAAQIGGKQLPQQGGATPSQPGQPGQPGGQLGQKGGGPGSANQPEAQSPVKPAPPVAPPSPT